VSKRVSKRLSKRLSKRRGKRVSKRVSKKCKQDRAFAPLLTLVVGFADLQNMGVADCGILWRHGVRVRVGGLRLCSHVARPAFHRANRPPSQLSSQPARRPPSQPGVHRASQASTEPGIQPSRHPAIRATTFTPFPIKPPLTRGSHALTCPFHQPSGTGRGSLWAYIMST